LEGKENIPCIMASENHIEDDVFDVDPENCIICNPVLLGCKALESTGKLTLYPGSSTSKID
jgi:hypothetical protein